MLTVFLAIVIYSSLDSPSTFRSSPPGVRSFFSPDSPNADKNCTHFQDPLSTKYFLHAHRSRRPNASIPYLSRILIFPAKRFDQF